MNQRRGGILSQSQRRYTLALLAATLLVPASALAFFAKIPEPAGVYGGDPSPTCAWPSTVSLGGCTGTLIHPEVVVYAAHCGDGANAVWFGEQAFAGDGFAVDVKQCVTKPLWNNGLDRHNDYAFCTLAEPVTDVPIVPPLMGCETTLLTPGREVTLVGFGQTDDDLNGIKHQVTTILHYIDDDGAAVIGGDGLSSCFGDSGGPVFVQLTEAQGGDGSWRVFGITSGPNVGGCGDAGWYATIFEAIPWIESVTGIDVTACHYTQGEWNPSPSCHNFPLEPEHGQGKSWANGCAGGPVTEAFSQSCGPAFDPSPDDEGPVSIVIEPEDRARLESNPDNGLVQVDVSAEASDIPSGVASVALWIDGTVPEDSVRLGPPWSWTIVLTPGVWEIRATATDWAGNEALSEPVVIGVDEDPPPAPAPEPEPGTGSSSGTADETGPVDEAGGGEVTTGDHGTAGSTTTDTAGVVGGNDGCNCRASSGSRGAGSAVFGLLALLGLASRRRRRWAIPGLTVCLLGCGDDEGAATTAESTTTTGGMDSTGVVSTGPAPMSTSSGTDAVDSSSTSTGPLCEPGESGCTCRDDLFCTEGLSCQLNTCVACPAGTFACPCVGGDEDEPGTCERGLFCIGGLCAAPFPCPYLMDGECDEPEGTNACFEGTDFFDCCATMDGVCEEASQGGRCPDGSDLFDCCATMDGVCEEVSQGGRCPDGSDPLDCSVGSTTGTTGDTETSGTTGDSQTSTGTITSTETSGTTGGLTTG